MYFGDSRLSDLEAELQKLAMDARCSPERVLMAYSHNQRPQVRIDLRASSAIPGLPSLVAAKTSPMPSNQRLRADDLEDCQDRRKPAIELDEEPPICVGQPNSAGS